MERLIAALLALGLVGCGITNPTVDDDDATADDDAATPDDDDDSAAGDDDDDATPPAVLVETTSIGDFSVDDLRAIVGADVVLENGYSLWTVRFATAGREALATVAIPYDVAVPDGGWTIVANQPGTTGADDPCAVSGTAWGAGLAGSYGARGFIGVALDYPGVGTDGVQPYLVAEVEGFAALDAVRAARELAAEQGIDASDRFALVGLSQGGHASLSAASRHSEYAPELDLRAVSISGPATAWEEQWSPALSVFGTHLQFHALLAWTWREHYGIDADPFAATLVNADAIFTTNCVSSPAVPAGTLSAVIGTNPYVIFTTEFIDAWQDGSWTGYEAYGEAFDANRIEPWADAPPLKVWQGGADTVVPEAFTAEFVAGLEAGGI